MPISLYTSKNSNSFERREDPYEVASRVQTTSPMLIVAGGSLTLMYRVIPTSCFIKATNGGSSGLTDAPVLNRRFLSCLGRAVFESSSSSEVAEGRADKSDSVGGVTKMASPLDSDKVARYAGTETTFWRAVLDKCSRDANTPGASACHSLETRAVQE